MRRARDNEILLRELTDLLLRYQGRRRELWKLLNAVPLDATHYDPRTAA